MDVTAVSFDNPLGDTQTEATALDSAVVGRFAAKESVEDTREQSRRDTRASVANLELCKTAVAAQFDAHQAIWLIVFDGVVSQIEQQLAQGDGGLPERGPRRTQPHDHSRYLFTMKPWDRELRIDSG